MLLIWAGVRRANLRSTVSILNITFSTTSAGTEERSLRYIFNLFSAKFSHHWWTSYDLHLEFPASARNDGRTEVPLRRDHVPEEKNLSTSPGHGGYGSVRLWEGYSVFNWTQVRSRGVDERVQWVVSNVSQFTKQTPVSASPSPSSSSSSSLFSLLINNSFNVIV